MSFKVGDRVAVYGVLYDCYAGPVGVAVNRKVAEVVGIPFENQLKIEIISDRSSWYFVNPKQCRKLVKKKRRRIWVRDDEMSKFIQGRMCAVDAMSFKPDAPCVEFVEVRKPAAFNKKD